MRAAAPAARHDRAVAAAIADYLLHAHKPLARAAVVVLASTQDGLVPADTWARALSRLRLRRPTTPRRVPQADLSGVDRWLDANRHRRRARKAALFHRRSDPRVLKGLAVADSLRLALEFSDPRLDAEMRLRPWVEPAFRIDGEWQVGLSALLDACLRPHETLRSHLPYRSLFGDLVALCRDRGLVADAGR